MAQNDILVEFIKTHPNAKLPTYANANDVGADVYTVEDLVLYDNETVMVSLGYKLAFCDPDFEIQIRPKSGLAATHGITVLNSPGTVDPDYRGDMKTLITKNVSRGGNCLRLPAGSKIAQMVIAPRYRADFGFTEETNETDRGEGGFGSTGL